MEREPIAVRHETVIERLTEAARRDDRIVAAWLQGSRADGSADPFSDIDFYVAVRDESFDPFDSLAFAQQAAPVLVHVELPFARGVACLLEGPVKLDLLVERQSSVGQALRPAVRVLVDRADVASQLRTGWEPDEAEIARQIDQALRMTYQGASWPVRLLRRGQWMTHAFSELTLIHSLIVPLLLVQHDRRAFHRNQMTRERLLPEAERTEVDALASDVLRALASRSLGDAYRAHVRIVELMGRVGREACAASGLEFPEAAEQEALRFYEREWPRTGVAMDAPLIERQVRRGVGGAAEATGFGSVQWAVREGDPAGAEQTIGLAVFGAGKGNVEHVHPNCEEVVYVLEGSVEHTLGDQRTRLEAGDLIVVPRGVAHRLLNDGSAPARTYIVFSSADRQFEPTGRT